LTWRCIWRNKLDVAVRVGALVILFVIFGNIKELQQTSREWVKVFREAGRDYEGVRDGNDEMRVAREAAARIPPDAVYYYTRRGNWTEVRVRYAMCPNNRTSAFWTVDDHRWQYFLDMGREVKDPPPEWNSVRLSGGVMLYSRPGYEIPPPAPRPAASLKRRLFAFAVLLFAQTLGGFAALSVAGIGPERGGSLWFLGASFLAGFAMLTGALWVWLVLGGSLTPAAVWIVAIGIPLLLGLPACRRCASRLRELVAEKSLRASLPLSPLGAAVAIGVAYYVSLYLVPVVLSPVYSFDALSHWVYKANVLFQIPTLESSKFTRLNEYPLLWPLNIAMQYVLAGGIHDELAKWTIAALLIAFLTQLMGACAMLGVSPLFTWAFLPLFIICFNDPSLRWAYADTPLIAFLAAALAALTGVFGKEGRLRYLVPGFLFLCAVAGTKFEGGPTVIVVAAALALCWPRFPLSWRGWLVGASFCLPALITIGWHWHQSSRGFVKEAHFQEPVTWGKVQLLFDNIFAPPDYWTGAAGWTLFAGMALFVALRFGEVWRPGERFLAITGLGLLGLSIVAFLGWPANFIRHQVYTALPRLILHAAPALFLFVASLMGRAPTTATGDGEHEAAPAQRL